MDVIVKGQPSIEVRMDAKVVDSYKTVDAALSESSVNPVQNKVITAELNKKLESSDVATIKDELAELSEEVSDGIRKNLVEGNDYIKVDGAYRTNGTIESGAYWHSSPIALIKGNTLQYHPQYTPVSLAIALVKEDGSFLKMLVANNTTKPYTYIATEDCYVSINCISASIDNVIQIVEPSLRNRTDKLEASVEILNDKVINERNLIASIDYEIKQGNINPHGIVDTSSPYWHSSPIEVKRGDKVTLETEYQGSGIAIGRTNSNGDYYQVVIAHDSSKKYVAEIQFDGYIAIGYIANQVPTTFKIETSDAKREKGKSEAYADFLEAQKEGAADYDVAAKNVEIETIETKLFVKAKFDRGKMIAELATLTEADILAQGSCGYVESNGSVTDGTITWKIYKGGLLHIKGYGKMYDFVKGTEATKRESEVHQQVRDLGAAFWYYGFVNENVNGIVPPFGQSNQKYESEEVMNYSNKRYVPFGEQINPLNNKPYGYSAPWYIYRTHVDDNYTSYASYLAKNPNLITYNRILIEEDIDNGGITYIGNWAFYRVSAESLILPNSVTKIGCWGVRYSPTLEVVMMGDNVVEIEDHGVSRMEAMRAIKISNKLQSLGYAGMESNAQISRVTFPSTTISLGTYCFNGCNSFQFGNFGSIARIPDDFAINAPLLEANIPSNAKQIGKNAYYRNQIKALVIPSEVHSIDNDAFRYTNAKVVRLESQALIDKFFINMGSVNAFLQHGACLAYCEWLLIPSALTESLFIEKFFLFKGDDGQYKYYKRDIKKLDS